MTCFECTEQNEIVAIDKSVKCNDTTLGTLVAKFSSVERNSIATGCIPILCPPIRAALLACRQTDRVSEATEIG